MGEWRVWIDTGGTFTDCLAVSPGGEVRRAKVLSSSALRGTVRERVDAVRLRVGEGWSAAPDGVRGFAFRLLGEEHPPVRVTGWDPERGVLRLDAPLAVPAEPGAAFEIVSPEAAPILAARLVTGTPADAPLPPLAMRLATTRGTNALLERTGAPTAFFVTRGFGDLLRIGTQQRPELFALDVRVPEALHHAVVEVPERLAADGSVLQALDLEAIAPAIARLTGQGVRVAAVALMHAYRNSRHEWELRELLLRAGFTHVSCSADLAPSIKILPRAETAVVDAYLSPVIGGYLHGVRSALGGGRLHLMTSAGGLIRPEDFRARDSLLSGPAGGVVGAALAGRRAGFPRTIAFDMGGTSTDVARFDGDFEYVWEHRVGGAHLVAPALAIESVAAGGGSVCAVGAQGVQVGPASAGASPGPACYGAGGPLALTDVNLLLGRLDPARFGIPLQPERSAAALEAVRGALRERTGEDALPEPLLEGFLRIANERMADAIRAISLRQGHDPAEYALVAFGGAGGQHACGVAERLGIRAVVVPPDAGLLSALGIGHAVLERFAERQVLRPLEEVRDDLIGWMAELAEEAARAMRSEGVGEGGMEIRRRIANLRFRGQESTLAVEWEPGVDLGGAFRERYRKVYGHQPEGRPIEVESLRVIVSTPTPDTEVSPAPSPVPAEATGRTRAWFGGAWTEIPVFDRARLPPGATLQGPALVWERHSATVVEAGWSARVDGSGALVMRFSPAFLEVEGQREMVQVKEPEERRLRRTSRTPQGAATTGDAEMGHLSQAPEAVTEELFTHRFQALVGEMGEQLRRTALSVNVKERLDFSCALLDPDGELVVNAPHVPVHLGALGVCVRSVRDALALRSGDVVATNHPAFGGSHLPDVTVVTPVHDPGGTLLGYVANRAHHAEIGGSRPGSMPPRATTLAEEGVVIPPTWLLRAGEERWDGVRSLLERGPFPSRAPDENLADLRAAVAANHRGAELLRELARAHGPETIAHYMRSLKGRAERGIRAALRRLGEGRYEATEHLDDGSPLRVTVEIIGDGATIDFAGSAPVHPGNLNATPAIVRSAVLYVLRLLVGEALPLNEGLMSAVDLRIPPGILNPPFPEDPAHAPAVVGGNTEVSQRLVDTLLRALGLAACSQGTMNNVLWGNDRFGYYETVCGGCGAGPGWTGASAVHSHMTNTRITDPEIVETRYPVRVERFTIRRGSGGAGRWRGGDGTVRELTFLEPMSLSVLSQHRRETPYGMEGGEAGATGRQRLIRASGETVELAPVDGCEVDAGDRLLLETPGGGGWGEAEP